jgi:hypothetical protein
MRGRAALVRLGRVRVLVWATLLVLTGVPMDAVAQRRQPAPRPAARPAAPPARPTTTAAAKPAAPTPPVAPVLKQMAVARVTGAIELDGRLDDAAWAGATFRSDFEQKGNDRSYPPRIRTEVAFLRDDQALYVAARMQNEPDGASRALLGRRDDVGSAERFLVSLDTHRDLATAYTFGVTVGGVRVDHMHARDLEGWRDDSFDPLWDARVATEADSWTAELRIPFSQLRFAPGDEQVWGLNVRRWNPTTYLDVYWVVIPYETSGWASRFGELRGLGDISGGAHAEITPYVVGRAVMLDQELGGDGSPQTQARVGGDLKAGVGSNLTLDATVNPDFGQVEADPAKVNLTQFETYFPEQRPFFLEGREIFRARGPNWFYSRRVGGIAAPAGNVARFERVEQATILGGAKLTGRLASGSSVGGLLALTQAERSPADPSGATREVAAGTAYAVGRLQQEVAGAGSSIGLTATAVGRSFDDDGLLASRLPSQAMAGGADWTLRFGGSAFELSGFLGGSYVSGSPEAMSFLQRTTGHFFQRPDAEHVEWDPLRTTMAGWTGGATLSKIGGEPWLWSLDVVAASPGFEIRDAGSQLRSDVVEARTSLSRVWRRDHGTLRDRRLGVALASGWNFAGDRRLLSPSVYFAGTWANLWTSSMQLGVTGSELSDDLARGGPLMRAPAAAWLDLQLNSATSSRAWWSVGANLFKDDAGGWSSSANAGMTVTAGKRLELGVLGGGSAGEDSRQFLVQHQGGPERTYGWRYVFSHLDRKELFTQLRAKLAFAPDAVLTLYAEPFISSGGNHDFGELVEARGGSVRVYGSPGSGSVIAPLPDGAHQVVDGRSVFRIENYDYWFRSFRGMAVLRWEMRPGSTVFLIWQKSRWSYASGADATGIPELFDSLRDPGQDIALAKVSFLLGRR